MARTIETDWVHGKVLPDLHSRTDFPGQKTNWLVLGF